MRELYEWNPVYNLAMEMKDEYENIVGEIEDYSFETWLERLNIEKYSDFFECLQVNQFNEFILIRYGLHEISNGMWTDQDSPYRECRSIVIDLVNDAIVLSPFRKFFNLNEVEENMIDVVSDKIKTAELFEVTDKLDGSMQNARWYNGSVFMAGSMAMDLTESWRLENGRKLLTKNYEDMLKDYSFLTFTFEYISDKNPHVVTYDSEQEGLYLIGARSVDSGYQLPYFKLVEIASHYKVKVVEMESKPLDELLELMEKLPANEKEGWIINIDGHLIKLKCSDYVNIHRILDKVASVNVIIEAIAEEYYDDLLSKVPVNYHGRVKVISEEVFNYTRTMNHHIVSYYQQAPKDDKKEFMLWVNNNAPKQIQPYVRSKYLGKEYNLLKRGVQGYKRMSELSLEGLE